MHIQVLLAHISITSGMDLCSRKGELFEVLVALAAAADGRAVRSRWFNFSHEKCPDEYI